MKLNVLMLSAALLLPISMPFVAHAERNETVIVVPTCEEEAEACGEVVEAQEEHIKALDHGMQVCSKGLETCHVQVEELDDQPHWLVSGIVGTALGIILSLIL